MISGIPPVQFPASVEALSPAAGDGNRPDFQNVLRTAIAQVEGSRATAESAIQNFIAGNDGELHSTVLATQKAELQFELLMQVRNKVVSAYEEIMKMQI